MNEEVMNHRFKRILLETMKSFDDFCVKNDIKYVAAYGTVIGAVRHKGLIPWDDDIDVFMDWDNYRKFLSLRHDATARGYRIVDRRDYGYYLPMAKYCSCNTTIWEQKLYPFIFGVYIDVFPLGFVSNINESRNLYDNYLMHSAGISKGYQRYSFSCDSVKYFIRFPDKFISLLKERKRMKYHQSMLDILDDKIAHIKEGKYRLYYRSMDGFEKSLFRSEWFEDIIRVPFEDFFISIPAGYHDYLSVAYGDYMTPPPAEKQITHHSHYYLNLNEGLTFDQVQERIKKGEHLVY